MDTVPRTVDEYRRWWAENAPVPYGFCWCGCGERPGIVRGQTISKALRFRGEPVRFVYRHQARQPLEGRYVVKDTGHGSPCWLWTGDHNRWGYGMVKRNKVRLSVHRVMYERHRGPIPAGLELDHLCGNPPCLNPAHLEPVTHPENVRRGRAAKLTRAQVDEIRRLRAETCISYRKLAGMFGVTIGAVIPICKGTAWRD